MTRRVSKNRTGRNAKKCEEVNVKTKQTLVGVYLCVEKMKKQKKKIILIYTRIIEIEDENILVEILLCASLIFHFLL